MPIINGLNFDDTRLGNARQTINHGHTEASRQALADDTLIKVHDLATRSNLPAKLTKGLQVTTYDPTDMKNPNNFFNFASTWEATILSIEQQFDTYFMSGPFVLSRVVTTPPTEAQMLAYELALTGFLAGSSENGGDAQSFVNPVTGVVVNRPVKPVGAIAIEAGGNILRDWHTMTLDEVVKHVENILVLVNNDVQLQNLSWSFKYFLDCCDTDLKTYVLSKISHLPPDIGRTGPVAFLIIAQRMIQTTENLAQKVINGFIALRLTHFEGENVVDAIFTVRNILKFLRYGEPTTFAPRTTLVLVYDVFRGCTVTAFRAFVQQAQDIVLKDETSIDVIFDHLQSKYEELLLADRWVPTKKRQSAFTLGEPKTRTYADAEKDKDSSKPSSSGKSNNDKPRERPTHDKKGNKIDYTPPKSGEPHERTRDGKTEFWCGQCGRWGNHPTNKHDEWRENLRKRRNGKGNGNGNSNNNGSANTNTNSGNSARGSVTFLSAVTGNTSLKVDSELSSGIDL